MKCRACKAPVTDLVLSLGKSPLANAFVEPSAEAASEPFFPLEVYVCRSCWLMQLGVFETPENIFGDYAYFSSFSDTWQRHVREYAFRMIEELGLGPQSLVVEIASNDGHLLLNFVERGIPVLGIEPARNVSEAARQKGVRTRTAFFGKKEAERLRSEDGISADLIAANNVLAHVPDLDDFVAGFKRLLKPEGVITFEFPHLLELLEKNQFDTIYHEHFSYFSFTTAERVLRAHGLKVFHVETLSTHGGSLRLFAAHEEDASRQVSEEVLKLRAQEERAGLFRIETYRKFAERVVRMREDIRTTLSGLKEQGKRLAAYGAPAKGNTLLNYCGIDRSWIEFTVDRSVHKQGKLLPGSRIPVRAPEALRTIRPDYILILPWNLEREIAGQLSYTREWGAKLLVPVPEMRVLG